ncbi:hypothetical protein ACERNI_06585 [Camelimonas sp. ID_303_24]
MHRRVFLASIAGAFAAIPALSRDASEQNKAALAFIEKNRIGENLGDLARQFGASTQTFQMIARSVGPQRARQMFQERLGREIPKFQGQWNRTLATVYGNHFSAAELRSLGKEREKSPYYAKLQSEGPAIATEMKSAGSPILAELLKQILVSMVKDAAPSGR